MKKPITVTVDREHGNSGDVITTIRGADDEVRRIACPGECSPYSALAGVRQQLEEALNDVALADVEPEPETVDDLVPAPSMPSAGDA